MRVQIVDQTQATFEQMRAIAIECARSTHYQAGMAAIGIVAVCATVNRDGSLRKVWCEVGGSRAPRAQLEQVLAHAQAVRS